MYPCAFIQLKNKSTKKLWKIWFNIHQINCGHRWFMVITKRLLKIHFELYLNAQSKGVSSILPRHFSNKLKKKDNNVYKRFQLFKSLAFLPLGMVDQGFEYIKKNIPANNQHQQQLNDYLQYFYSTWMTSAPFQLFGIIMTQLIPHVQITIWKFSIDL
jgi:hypothetical protein